MIEQFPIFVLMFPLFGAILVTLLGFWKQRLAFPITLIALGGSLFASVETLRATVEAGDIVYYLGGWPRPFGIEFHIDQLNAIVLLVISTSAFLAGVYSKRTAELETPEKTIPFYILYLLMVTALLGITLTGDAFNLYVLVEVSSLTGYALIAMGSRRAAFAAFRYVIMGTIGASFYLLGVGYLYIKTGSLNMIDIREVIHGADLVQSPSIQVAFIFIMIGLWIKMAFFPLHAWLPNAYSFAPIGSACLIAPLVTKVTVYIMIRIMITVFGADYVFGSLPWSEIVSWLAVIAIIAGSIMALAQTDLRRMLGFLIVAEVGYMVGGAWLANQTGLIGSIFHIVSDAFMTLCLFLFAGIVFLHAGVRRIRDMQGLFHTMPVTMFGFTVGALAMIGVPPTCGFFSKWYLINGGIEAGHWGFVIALLVSSLINAILFFRIIEIAYFEPIDAPDHDGHRKTHGHSGTKISEAPMSMLLPLCVAALSLVLIGLFNHEIVVLIKDFLVSAGMPGPPS